MQGYCPSGSQGNRLEKQKEITQHIQQWGCRCQALPTSPATWQVGAPAQSWRVRLREQKVVEIITYWMEGKRGAPAFLRWVCGGHLHLRWVWGQEGWERKGEGLRRRGPHAGVTRQRAGPWHLMLPAGCTGGRSEQGDSSRGTASDGHRMCCEVSKMRHQPLQSWAPAGLTSKNRLAGSRRSPGHRNPGLFLQAGRKVMGGAQEPAVSSVSTRACWPH